MTLKSSIIRDRHFCSSAGSEVTGGMAVAFGAVVLKGKGDHRPPDQCGGQGMFGLQQLGCRGKEFISVAVQLLVTGQDQISGQRWIRPTQTEDKSLKQVGMVAHMGWG